MGTNPGTHRSKWTAGDGIMVRRLMHGPWNVYALASGPALALVDTGPRLTRRLAQTRLAPLTREHALRALILTHTHFDHAANAAWFKRVYGLAVVAHASECAYLRAGDSPLPEGSILAARLLMHTIGFRAQALFRYAGVAADIAVDQGFDLGQFGLAARVIHTPGHTQGSQSIIAGRLALVGDALYGNIPGKVLPPFADDLPSLIETWKTLLDTGCELFLPGHGAAIERGVLEREYARYARRME